MLLDFITNFPSALRGDNLMNIELTPKKDIDGTIDYIYRNFKDGIEFDVTPNQGANFTLFNQEQLDMAMFYAEKYQVPYIGIEIQKDNVSLDFSNLDYINKIKHLSFYVFGKKFSLNILPKNCNEINSIDYLKFYSDYPCNFNQFDLFKNLKKLDIIYHNNSTSWLKLDNLLDLYIYKFKEDDLSSLSTLINLKRLHLQKGSLKSLKGIGDLPNLETLYVDDLRYLTDVSNLVDAKSLENIRFIPFKKVTDWDFLATMPQLKLIGLDVAESVGFMEQMPNLVCAWCVKIKDKNEKPIIKLDTLYNVNSTICKEQYDKAFTVKRFVEGH